MGYIPITTKEKDNKSSKSMLYTVLAAASLCSLTAGAPQYGDKTAPLKGSVQCRTEYATIWDTKYKETETQVCTTEYEKVCRTETQRLCQPTTRQECNTVYEKQCQTVYKSVCVEKYKTEYEPYTETECSTQYKEDCEHQREGYGNDKVWAPIAGTCKKNPYDECKDVTKTKEKQVAYPVCNDVPEQKCVDVPRQECVSVPDQICTNQPLQKCQDVPKQNCQAVHKKIPVRISRQVPKKVCQDGHSGVFNAVPAVIKGGADVRTGILFEKQIHNRAENENTIVFGN